MAFSQSFVFGNSTLLNIEKDTKNAMLLNGSKNQQKDLAKENYKMEVIEESPTNKNDKSHSNRSGLRGAISQSKKSRKKILKRNKSDSLLNNKNSLFDQQEQNSKDNLSDYFKSDINFPTFEFSSGGRKSLSEVNISDIEKAVLDAEQKLQIDCLKNGDQDLFNDSFGVNIQTPLFAIPKNIVKRKPKSHSPVNHLGDSKPSDIVEEVFNFDESFHTNREDASIPKVNHYQTSPAGSEFLENKTETKDDCDIINVEETSFIMPVSELNNGNLREFNDFVCNEIEESKKDISRVLKESNVNIVSEEVLSSNRIKEKPSPDVNLSTSEKPLLNWSASSNDTSISCVAKTPALIQEPSLQLENLKSMSSWNLPNTLLKEYENKGIKNMFEWQVQCLSNPKVLFEYSNLVYSAPTSAGKTLVSEILTIKTVLERNKKALIILPFISVVREKMLYFQDLLTSSGYRVEGFFGGYTPPGGFDSIHVAICTIEKANAIVNKLLESQKLEQIGVIIVDEIHLISDPGRGYILELLLAKILYMCRKYDLKIQIVTMSATLPNVDLLRKWLNAEFYLTDFRPVELREMIKVGNNIYDNKMKLLRNLNSNGYESLSTDPDNVAQLCIETINEECSIIVFCPSKDWCESLCLHIAESIFNVGKSKTEIGDQLRKQIQRDKLNEVKEQFKNCPTGLDSILNKTITYACAFHHAGLTSDERDIIETNFKCGHLKVIVATSTLSSGVNLPARRVIIRSPLFGGKKMNSITYKQMIGRAGRTGKDTLGESILICSEANSKSGKELVCAELKPLTSCLDTENSSHLKRALLEVISSGVATTRKELATFTSCTLLHAEKCRKFKFFDTDDENIIERIQRKKLKVISKQNIAEEEEYDPITETMEFLVEYEFIRLHLNEESNEMMYVATRLGNACLASSMPPSDGLLLFSELQRSRQCFVLESELHAVYLVTPYSVCYQIQDLDWLAYLDMWEKLSAPMKKVGELVGVKESFLVRAMRGQSNLDYKAMQVHKRFYTALALNELVNEAPINKIASKYKCSRGLLQSLQQMASTFAGIVTSFCNSLNWTMLALIVSQFKDRLYFGVHRDLIDLMRITDLNAQRARALFNAGIVSLIDLANADSFSIEKILHNCISFDSEKKRDNEDLYDADKRNNMRNLYVTGKEGITIQEAAKMMKLNARKFLEYEMGVASVKWTQEESAAPAAGTPVAAASIQKMEDVENKEKSITMETIKQISSNESSKKNKRTASKPIAEINEGISPPKNSKVENLPSTSKTVIDDIAEGQHILKDTQTCSKFKTEAKGTPKARNKTQNKTSPNFTIRRSPRNHASSSALDSNKLNASDIFDDSSFEMNTKMNDALDTNPKLDPNLKTGSKISEPKSPTSNNVAANKSSDEIANSQPINTDSPGRSFRRTQNSRLLNSRVARANTRDSPKSRKENKENNNNSNNIKKSSILEISDSPDTNSLFKDPIQLNASHILSTSKSETSSGNFNCIQIINACGDYTLFKNVFEELSAAEEISFSIGIEKLSHTSKPLIGGNLLINQQQAKNKDDSDKLFIIDDSLYLSGISISMGDNLAFFVNMQDAGCDKKITKVMKIEAIESLLKNINLSIKMFDSKEQLKLLKKVVPKLCKFQAKLEDPIVANWLLQPDVAMGFNKMTQQYAPECSALAGIAGKSGTYHSIGLNYNSSITGKVRSSVECCVTPHILKEQLENLERIGNGQLRKFFHELEMPIQHSLYCMETTGFPVDESSLGKLAQELNETLKRLEKKIYDLHGSRFSLSSSSAVARVLGLHKKPNGRFSTTKQILEKIDTPISILIVNYRKLSVILSKNIQPLLRNINNGRIHGNSITFTITGRISMHEPNLQNVAKDVEINNSDVNKRVISCRSCFLCCPGQSLISADFCQLEIRILTHLSQDDILVKIMKSEQDIFTSIAARWNQISEEDVSESVRDGTKQICYGIIYGMGMKTLAEALKCDEQEALTLSEQFHMAYPGIRAYTQKIVRFARQNGFVETITGRRRYIPNINSSEPTAKAQAERQAINTAIQGSAADIAKNAILRMEKNLAKYETRLKINIPENPKSMVNFVLHLHDELLFEVPTDKASKIANVLKVSMENCVQLNVPLRVKLKIGPSWGKLQEIKL